MKVSRILSCSSALTIRSLSSSAEAFQIPTFPSSSLLIRSRKDLKRSQSSVPNVTSSPHHPLDSILSKQQLPYRKAFTTRTFFSQGNSNNEDSKNESFLEKVKNKIPSFLKPKSMLTKREKSKQEAKDNVSSSIDTILKDAPLGVRMMGKMISPIISSVAGNLAEAMEEQSRQMNDLLDDARMYIVSDASAVDLLGEPVEVGMPFSQSSSSMNVNGRSSSRINASFEVRGGRGAGVATMDATDGQLSRLTLNVNGRNLNISLTKSASPAGSSYSSKRSSGGIGKNRGFNEDDIIDAEFVEKKVDK